MWIILCLVIFSFCCYYVKKKYSYWKERGLVTPRYHYFVGNLLEQFLFKKNSAEIMRDNYRNFERYNYIGYYNAMQPAILLRSPEIIGDVLTKDFNSFMDNDFDINEVDDPIFGKNPFILKGLKWKQVRQQATPSFTSGKIKLMLPLLKETSNQLQGYLSTKTNIDVDLFELATRITAENVATCAFGVNGNSFTDTNAIFVAITNKLIDPSFKNILKGFMIFLCPPMARLLRPRFFQVETVEKLMQIIQTTLKYRENEENNKNQRNDFLDDMNNLKQRINNLEKFDFSDILGHAGGFLIDGLLTSSSVVAYLIYNIAKHTEIQENLRREIANTLKESNQELTYENIQEMLYLDSVFKENLRLHPPLMFMTRRVTQPYLMKPPQDGATTGIWLEVGTAVIIPTLALHTDEKYFADADKFIPERWLPENRGKITKNTYLPFGDGPRVCLGMKFGVLQSKMAVISVLRQFRIKTSAKMRKLEPLQIDPVSFLNLPLGGVWVEFEKL